MRDRPSPRTKLAIVYVAAFLLILGLSASWKALRLSDTPAWVSLLVAVFGGVVAVRFIAMPFMKASSSEEASIQLLLTSMTDRTGQACLWRRNTRRSEQFAAPPGGAQQC